MTDPPSTDQTRSRFNPELFTFDPQADYPWRVFERVTVATVTFNRLEYTRRFLDGILKHTHLPCELLVVDNASDDGTVEFLRGLTEKLPQLRVIENKRNVGLGRAVLQIRDRLTDGLAVLFDNDTEVLSNYWLTHLLKAFHAIRLARGAPRAVLGCRLINCEEYGFRFASRLEVLPIPSASNGPPRTSYAAVGKDDPRSGQRLDEAVVIGWTEHLLGATICVPVELLKQVRLEDYYPLYLDGYDSFMSGQFRQLGIPFGYIENGPVVRHNDWPYSEAKIALYERLARERAVTDAAYVRWKLGSVLRRLRRRTA